MDTNTIPTDVNLSEQEEEEETQTTEVVSINCEECQCDFSFTSDEQEFYKNLGFDLPKRCNDCRKRIKKERFAKTKVVCSGCAIDTTVPFKPRFGKPVFCNDCFAKQSA